MNRTSAARRRFAVTGVLARYLFARTDRVGPNRAGVADTADVAGTDVGARGEVTEGSTVEEPS